MFDIFLFPANDAFLSTKSISLAMRKTDDGEKTWHNVYFSVLKSAIGEKYFLVYGFTIFVWLKRSFNITACKYQLSD